MEITNNYKGKSQSKMDDLGVTPMTLETSIKSPLFTLPSWVTGWGPQSIAFSCLRKVAKHGRYNELVTGRYNEYNGL